MERMERAPPAESRSITDIERVCTQACLAGENNRPEVFSLTRQLIGSDHGDRIGDREDAGKGGPPRVLHPPESGKPLSTNELVRFPDDRVPAAGLERP